MSGTRVILIGGSSNSGKTTLAAALAERIGWSCISTDSLARHPGRPWRTERGEVPEHVAEHYRSLSVDELIADVLRHYRGMWPEIESLIRAHATDEAADRLILEGSALWPESVATLEVPGVEAVWLTGSDELFRERIHRLSNYGGAVEGERELVRKFLERTCAYDEKMMQALRRLGLPCIDVEPESDLRKLCEEVLANCWAPTQR